MNNSIEPDLNNISPDAGQAEDLPAIKERLSQLERENEELKQQLSQQDFILQSHYQFYNFAPICFLRIDDAGNICRANTETGKLFGRTEQELLHLNIQSFIQPDSRATFSHFLRYAFQTHEIASCELKLSLKEDALLTIDVKGLVLHDEKTCFLSICDITKEIESKQALIESQQKYIELTDSLPVAIFETDVNGFITYVNKQAKEWFGYSDADFQAGLHFIQCFPENEHLHIIERFRLSISSSTTVTNEYSVKRKDGTLFPVQISSSAIFRDNQRIGVRGIIIDLTEQKQIEEKHQRHEAWFQETLENMIEGYQLIGFDWRYRYLNNTAIRQSQRKEEDLIGKTMMEAYPGVDKSRFFQSLMRVMEERTTLNIENKFTYSNGETCWFELRVHPVPNGIAILSIDISERKKAELDILEYSEKLKKEVEEQTAEIRHMADFQNAILKHSGLAIIPLSPEGIILSFNPAAEKLTGYSAEEVVGKFSPIIFNDMEKIREEARLMGCLTDDSDLSDEELLINLPLLYNHNTIEREYIRKDHTRVSVLLNAVTLKNEKGEATGHVRFAIDNTERKNAEEKLLQALRQEKELNELKSRFVSTTSHEFRTPLSSILLTIDSLIHYRDKMNKDQLTLRLERIKDQTLHLSRIVEDILQLSKIKDGKMTYNPEQVELVSLCRNFIDLFIDEHSLQGRINFNSFTPKIEIEADNRLMRQILNNLLSNAVKYSPANPLISVEISDAGQFFCLKIRDNGVGIPKEDQKHLFTPFFRASNVSLIHGNGLGLSIVKEAIGLHGGDVRVQSNVEIGTTFIVELPKTRLS